MKKVLLYSGGTDSWLINQIWKPDILLYVDMGTQYSKEELQKIDAMGRPKNLVVVEFPLGQWEDKETAFIPQRNLYLLMIASHFGEHICLGATKEDAGGSSDKDESFLVEAEQLLGRLWKKQSLYEGKPIIIETRFCNSTKEELLQEYLAGGGSIEAFKSETFSCYAPEMGHECLSCKACFRKFVVCYLNGGQYSEQELMKMYHFIEQNVIHRSRHAQGRYFMDKDNCSQTLEAILRLYDHLGKAVDFD